MYLKHQCAIRAIYNLYAPLHARKYCNIRSSPAGLLLFYWLFQSFGLHCIAAAIPISIMSPLDGGASSSRSFRYTLTAHTVHTYVCVLPSLKLFYIVYQVMLHLHTHLYLPPSLLLSPLPLRALSLFCLLSCSAFCACFLHLPILLCCLRFFLSSVPLEIAWPEVWSLSLPLGSSSVSNGCCGHWSDHLAHARHWIISPRL